VRTLHYINNGLVVTKLRVNSLIATIGTMMMLQGGVYLFTREAVLAIHDASQGVPRTINVICDNALIGGFAAQERAA